jgi:uncharacterized glyoxalase superfamily protein PhnB
MPNDPTADSAPTALVAQSLDASLTVADIRLSLAWYLNVLHFTVDREFEREGRLFAVSLRAGAIRVLLTQDDGSKGLDRVKGVGFSLQITTAQDIDALASNAKHAGAVLDTEPTDAFGARVFRLRDPDGFRWVVSSPRARP